MAFKVEYRCFNCVATCPAEIHTTFHGDKAVRRDYLEQTLKPLTYTRRQADQQFVIDTPAARDALGIPPGEWRTPVDTTVPTTRPTFIAPIPGADRRSQPPHGRRVRIEREGPQRLPWN